MSLIDESKRKAQIKTMVVAKIVVESDRTLIYGEGCENDFWSYHVIAGTKVKVKIGDRIEYEPEGMNFGWFVKVIT